MVTVVILYSNMLVVFISYAMIMSLPIVHVCVFVCMSIHFKAFVAGLKTHIVEIDLSIKTVPVMHLKETKHNDG